MEQNHGAGYKGIYSLFTLSMDSILFRDLSRKYGIAITHFSEQAHHNKDRADGEISRAKDKLKLHLIRQSADSDDWIEVKDSQSFCKFGEKYLAKPGPRSGIEKRLFYDLNKATVALQRDEVLEFIQY